MFATDVLIWAGVGLTLMLAELIIPGGIIVFLGLGGIIVAGSLQLGLIEGWVHAFTLWFISSLVLLIAFRNTAQKMVGGDSTIENTDEELDIYGHDVEVTETIGPGDKMGRVEYQGTSWTALGDGSTIEAGSHAKIVCRDNISLVVEKI